MAERPSGGTGHPAAWPYAYSLMQDSGQSRVSGQFHVVAMPAAFGGAPTAALVVASLFPFYWAVVSSLSPEASLFERPSLVPRHFVLEHYRTLFDERNFWVPIRNSLVVAGTTTLFCVVFGAFGAYAIARLEFRGKAWILGFILAVTMFPQISIVSPLYVLLRGLRLINTYPGLILPYLTFAMPLCVWLLVSFFRQLPRELEESALVDGAGRLRTFREIILPLSWPGLATTAIITFVYCWNEFLFALSFTLGPERHTVPVAIALFRGQYQVPWGQIRSVCEPKCTHVGIRPTPIYQIKRTHRGH